MAQFTTEQLMDMINENKSELLMTWAGGESHVKYMVGLGDIISIVMQTAAGCFDEDGEYMPEVKDALMWSNIVDAYTDIELPEDIMLRSEIFMWTNLTEMIKEFVNIDQISAIQDAIDARIANMIAAGNNLMMKKVIDSVVTLTDMQDSLNSALAKFNGINPAELQEYVQQSAEKKK